MPSTSRSVVAILCGILIGCSAASSPQTCGNGIVEGQETCDDGNRRDGDGCSATCQVEPAAKVDCAGTQGGEAFLDHCNQCVGGSRATRPARRTAREPGVGRRRSTIATDA